MSVSESEGTTDWGKRDRGLAVSFFILGLSWLYITIFGNDTSRILGLIMTSLWFTNAIVYYGKYKRQIKEK
jgi:uncharacterized RDD family membrane protein YckC